MIRSTIVHVLLPFACWWVKYQERIILRDGVKLTPQLMEDAIRIGIARPEQVRLKVVEHVPLPLPRLLQKAAERLGLESDSTIGMALGYGVNIRADCWGERGLVIHELAHVAQYERLGGIK